MHAYKNASSIISLFLLVLVICYSSTVFAGLPLDNKKSGWDIPTNNSGTNITYKIPKSNLPKNCKITFLVASETTTFTPGVLSADGSFTLEHGQRATIRINDEKGEKGRDLSDIELEVINESKEAGQKEVAITEEKQELTGSISSSQSVSPNSSGVMSDANGAVADIDQNMDYEYEDQDIDAILSEYRRQIKNISDNSVQIVHATSSLQAIQERINGVLVSPSSKDKTRVAQTILIPFDIGNHHWIGLVIRFDVSCQQLIEVLYIDPYEKTIPKKIKDFFMSNYGKNINDKLQSKKLLQQINGPSSGPLTAENLSMFLEEKNKREEVIDDKEIKKIRQKHINLLEKYRPDLDFDYKQSNGIRSFSYPGISSRIWLTPMEQEEISEKDKIAIQNIIDLCEEVIAKCKDHPEFIIEDQGKQYLKNISIEVDKISWSLKNNPKYHDIPWGLLGDPFRYVINFCAADMALPLPTIDKALVNIVSDQDHGLRALQKYLEAMLSSDEDVKIYPTLLTRLLGEFYDYRIYIDLSRRLQNINDAPIEIPLQTKKLALLRTLQVAGEYCKNLAFIDDEMKDKIPRKLLMKIRDDLSHLDIKQNLLFEKFLTTAVEEELKRDLEQLLLIMSQILKKEGVIRKVDMFAISLTDCYERWDRSKEKELAKSNKLPDLSKEWPGFSKISQIFGQNNEQLNNGMKVHGNAVAVSNSTNKSIENVLNLLLPFPSHEQQTKDFFTRRKTFVDKIDKSFGGNKEAFLKTLESMDIPLLEANDYDVLHKRIVSLQKNKIDNVNAWKKFRKEKCDQASVPLKDSSDLENLVRNSDFENFKKFFHDKAKTKFSEIDLTKYWNELRERYLEFQKTDSDIEKEAMELLNIILGADNSEIEQFEKNKRKTDELTKKRNDLKNELHRIAKISLNFDHHTLAQEQYAEFKNNVEKIVGAQIDDGYDHHKRSEFLEKIFSEITAIDYDRNKEDHYDEDIAQIFSAMNMLREVIGEQYIQYVSCKNLSVDKCNEAIGDIEKKIDTDTNIRLCVFYLVKYFEDKEHILWLQNIISCLSQPAVISNIDRKLKNNPLYSHLIELLFSKYLSNIDKYSELPQSGFNITELLKTDYLCVHCIEPLISAIYTYLNEIDKYNEPQLELISNITKKLKADTILLDVIKHLVYIICEYLNEISKYHGSQQEAINDIAKEIKNNHVRLYAIEYLLSLIGERFKEISKYRELQQNQKLFIKMRDYLCHYKAPYWSYDDEKHYSTMGSYLSSTIKNLLPAKTESNSKLENLQNTGVTETTTQTTSTSDTFLSSSRSSSQTPKSPRYEATPKQQPDPEDTIEGIGTREWYSDDHINIFMDLYFNQLGQGRMHAISTEADDGNILLQNLEGRERQLGDDVTRIVIPINLGRYNVSNLEAGNHWVGLYILRRPADGGAYQIYYFDPQGNDMSRNLRGLLDRLYTGADYIINPIRFQNDGYNCGPWVIEILRSLVEKQALPSIDFDINIARLQHRQDYMNYQRQVREVERQVQETRQREHIAVATTTENSNSTSQIVAPQNETTSIQYNIGMVTTIPTFIAMKTTKQFTYNHK